MAVDGAPLCAGLFALLVFAFPWVRMRFRGPGTVPLASVHLNRRWGRMHRDAVGDRKTQAVNEVLRCIQRSGSNPVDPQLLEDIGAHLEAESQRASRVVPAAHTSWLVVLTLAEALQYVALPFAPVVGWNDSMISKVLCYGLPQHHGDRYMEIVLWIVLSPVLVLIFLASLACSLRLALWVASMVCCTKAWACMMLSKGVCLVMQFGVVLYIRVQELIQEFGSLFMFVTLLMVFYCPKGPEGSPSLAIKPGVRCWQGPRHCMYIALSMLQLLFQFCMVGWNNLPLYTFCRPEKHSATNEATARMGKCFQKDDHMTFLTQASMHAPAILADTSLPVFDFDRPMFSSTWLAFSGSLKFGLAACFVFSGHNDGSRWLLLGLAMACYMSLLGLNLFMAPCTMHWINCARSVSLVAGLWATLCGFAVAGTGPDKYILTTFAIGVVIIAAVVLPALLIYGFRSMEAYRSGSSVLRGKLLSSYQTMVVLFRLLMVRVTPKGVIVSSSKRSGVYTIKGLEVAKPSGALFQGSLRKFRADVEDWVEWADWGALICPAACCPCLFWVPLASPDEGSLYNVCKEQHEKHRYVEPSTHSLIGTSTSKVEKWMESADLAVDPDKDMELGFDIPHHVQLTIGDGRSNSTGIGLHNLFYNTSACDFKGGNGNRASLSAALCRSTPLPPLPRPNMSRSEDEGPSSGRLDARAVQTIERAYGRNEPQVPVPQMCERVERPRSSAFDTRDNGRNQGRGGRRGKSAGAKLGIKRTRGGSWKRNEWRKGALDCGEGDAEGGGGLGPIELLPVRHDGGGQHR